MEEKFNWYLVYVPGGGIKEKVKIFKEELKKQSSEITDKINEVKSFSSLRSYLLIKCSLNKKIVNFFYKLPIPLFFFEYNWKEEKLPSPVPDSLVKKFLNEVEKKEQDEIFYNDKEKSEFTLGGYVKINDEESPFFGCEGKIINLDEKKKVLEINLDFFGRVTTAVFSFDKCAKAF